MYQEDEQGKSFTTEYGIFFEKVMPFGLKNTRVTYQRLMTMMFAKLLRKNKEAYIDDMLIKSILEEDHLADLE